MHEPALMNRHSDTTTIGTTEDKLLCATARYQYLTAAQATKLLFSPGSLKYVMEKLSNLTTLGYLLALGGRKNGLPRIYTPTRKGRVYAQERGIAIPERFRPAEEHEKEKNIFFMRHTLAVIDVLINAELLSHTVQGIALKRMYHEHALKRTIY